MGEKLIIGPIDRGLRTDREAFVIDNDSFPTLINAYQWRGRVKRKRGTTSLTRLQRDIGITDAITGNFTIIINPHPLQAGISVFTIDSTIFVDWDIDSSHNPVTLITNSLTSSATLNRLTGELIVTGANTNPSKHVIYFPALPVMGEEDWADSTQAFPGTIGFDTTYAYNITTSFPYTPIDISFYKNPSAASVLNYTNYVAKITPTPLWWNGANYQQFQSVNYQGALWVTNGLSVPFVASTAKIGMQFAPASSIAYVSNTATTIVLTIATSPLVIGDFVFFNEWGGVNAINLNFQSGYVTAIAGANYTFTLPQATLGAGPYIPGIVQYLTNRSDNTLDNIRWYDGSGWVNFMPPLSMGDYIIDDAPQDQYYLVGAKIIFAFKNRLLFFGPIIQNSATGSSKILLYLQDAIVYSQDGTPYYTASFTNDPIKTDTIFNSILVPNNQTATPTAYWEDQFGFGGNQPAGIDQAITTVETNEDALIVGFNQSVQTRVIFTGNDIQPFQFYIINDELGSSSTFSSISMDEGVISRGTRGFVITSQTSCARIDLDILDQVFEISNQNNGSERFCAQRDFRNEWIYFTYNSNEFNTPVDVIFPNQSLQYNYRDQSWAIFNEVYTTYGTFQKKTGLTWANIGTVYPTWNEWNDPWNSGASNLLQPVVIAGNQQGYIIERGVGTGEAKSLYINNLVGDVVTSVNHCLNTGDFIVINDVQGTLGSVVNGIPFSVFVLTNSTFSISNPHIGTFPGTYLGGGTITRMYIPQIYSKQFPVSWELARKTRLGVQQYLFTKTDNAQITLLQFLSTDIDQAFNDSVIVPDEDSINNGLVYSTVLYTCPESTNLGLTSANTNLQQITKIDSSGNSSNSQKQIWHRMNTSLIGDTVQFGFTLSSAQMFDSTLTNQFAEIEFHAAILDLSPSGFLS